MDNASVDMYARAHVCTCMSMLLHVRRCISGTKPVVLCAHMWNCLVEILAASTHAVSHTKHCKQFSGTCSGGRRTSAAQSHDWRVRPAHLMSRTHWTHTARGHKFTCPRPSTGRGRSWGCYPLTLPRVWHCCALVCMYIENTCLDVLIYSWSKHCAASRQMIHQPSLTLMLFSVLHPSTSVQCQSSAFRESLKRLDVLAVFLTWYGIAETRWGSVFRGKV